MKKELSQPISDRPTISVKVYPEGNGIVVSESDSHTTTFIGIVENKMFFTEDQISRMQKLLLRAVNNRTRERNYFKKYAEMADGHITEEEFDKEIDEHEDEYMAPDGEDASMEDIHTMLMLAPQIKDANDVEDLASLFSVSYQSFGKCLTK